MISECLGCNGEHGYPQSLGEMGRAAGMWASKSGCEFNPTELLFYELKHFQCHSVLTHLLVALGSPGCLPGLEDRWVHEVSWQLLAVERETV